MKMHRFLSITFFALATGTVGTFGATGVVSEWCFRNVTEGADLVVSSTSTGAAHVVMTQDTAAARPSGVAATHGGTACKAAQFAASQGDYLKTAAAFTALPWSKGQGFTVEAWVRLGSAAPANGTRQIFSTRGTDAGNPGFSLGVTSDAAGVPGLSFVLDAGPSEAVVKANGDATFSGAEAGARALPFALNKWVHVAATYNGGPAGAGEMLLYVNGKGAGRVVLPDCEWGANTSPAYIGASLHDLANSFWDGMIERVRVSSRVLKPAQFMPFAVVVEWDFTDVAEGEITSVASTGELEVIVSRASVAKSPTGVLTSMAGKPFSAANFTAGTDVAESDFLRNFSEKALSAGLPWKSTVDFTVEAWVLLKSYPTGGDIRQIFSTRNTATGNPGISIGVLGTTSGLFAQLDGGTPSGSIRANANPTLDGTGGNTLTFPLNTWTHVAATYTGAIRTMRLYINNVCVGSKTLNAGDWVEAAAPTGGQAYGPHIGTTQLAPNSPGGFWDGLIAKVRISNETLRPEQFMTIPGCVTVEDMGTDWLITDTDPDGGLNEELSFVNAFRFSSGVVHLEHSVGIQGDPSNPVKPSTERRYEKISLDDGRTWSPVSSIPGLTVNGENTVELQDGTGLSMEHFPNKHPVNVRIYGDGGQTLVTSGSVAWAKDTSDPVALVDENTAMRCYSSLRAYTRSTPDDWLLQSGFEETPTEKYRSYINESTDKGQTWRRLATFYCDVGGVTRSLTESSVIRAANGDLLMASRGEEASNHGIWMSRSTDSGATWTPMALVHETFGGDTGGGGHSVKPGFFMTKNGILVFFCGVRKGNSAVADHKFWFSLDGNGLKWDRKYILYGNDEEVPTDEPGSGYISVMEVDDGDGDPDTTLLHVIYDQSGAFGHDNLDPNRIVLTKIRLNKEGITPPEVTAITPTSVRIGNSITITGLHLAGAYVTIGGVAATVTASSASSLTVTVPDAALGTSGEVVVTVGDRSTTATQTLTVLPPPPEVTVITPLDVHPGNSITITGQNLTGATVTIGGVAATVTVGTDTSLTVTVPDGALGTDGTVIVTVGSDSDTADQQLTITAPPPDDPVISGITPLEVHPGDSITITGQNLSGVTVTIGGVAATITAGTATSLTVTVPEGALGTTGAVVVSLGDTHVTASQLLVITPVPPPPPVITSIAPLNAHPGDTVLITGENLAGVTAISIGGVPALVVANTGSSITVMMPYNTAGGTISVTTAGGSTVSTGQVVIKPDIGTSGLLSAPSGVVVAAGTPAKIYVSDTAQHTVQVIESGALRLLAGQAGLAGSLEGTGSSARFNKPRGLAINRAGVLLVADSGNHRLRAVTATGVVTTTGTAGADAEFEALADVAAHDAASGESYIADTGNHLIKKITASGDVSIVAGSGVSGTANGPLLDAQFDAPAGVAVDVSGSYLYVADTNNHVIRLINLSAGAVSTFAGKMAVRGVADGNALTAAAFDSPGDLIVDGDGDVYVADTGNSRIRMITSESGTRMVSTLSGSAPGFVDGAGGLARFSKPSALAMGADGTLYIADTGNGAVRYIAPGPVAIVSTIKLQAGSPISTGGTTAFYSPHAGEKTKRGGGAPSLWFMALLGALVAVRRFRR